MDGNLGRRAEDAAPRSNAARHSRRPKRVRTTQEARRVGPALCRLLCNPAKEPTQASPTRLVHSALRQYVVLSPASRSASNSIALRAASASLGDASATLFLCFRPARSYAPGHTYWNRVPATRGQVCWPCPLPVAPQLCGGADPSLNNQTRPLRATPACCTFASFALRILIAPLREQSAQVSVPSLHLCFWCVRPARNYAPGQAYWNRDGTISDQESPFCRLAEGSIGPRANLREESGRSSRDIIGTTGAGPSGLLASSPGARAWATPFCPFLAKTGGSRWDFIAIYEQTDGLYESQYRRLFY